MTQIYWVTKSPGHHYIYSVETTAPPRKPERFLCFLILLRDGRYVDYNEYFVKGGYKNDPCMPGS